MYQRDSSFIHKLIEEGVIDENKADASLKLLINTHQSYIYRAWIDDDRIDVDEHNDSFMELFEYVIETAK